MAIYMLCELPVRVKTFSTHVMVKKCHGVRKMAGFTHASQGITFKRPGAFAVTWFLTITKSNPRPNYSQKSAIFTI